MKFGIYIINETFNTFKVMNILSEFSRTPLLLFFSIPYPQAFCHELVYI